MQTAVGNNMINLIREMTMQKDYEHFAIGITDDSEVYYRLNVRHETAMLSYKSATMIKDAFRYFGEQGMTQLPQIGKRAKSLYIFRTDGKTFEPPIF